MSKAEEVGEFGKRVYHEVSNLIDISTVESSSAIVKRRLQCKGAEECRLTAGV